MCVGFNEVQPCLSPGVWKSRYSQPESLKAGGEKPQSLPGFSPFLGHLVKALLQGLGNG